MEKSVLEKLYRMMVRIRFCEESLVDPIVSGEIKCPVHLYTGEEAVATGICSALDDKDYVFSNHRSHGHYLAKGGDMKKLVAEIYTKETGCSKGRGGSMHVSAIDKGFLGSAPIVSGTISLALGASMAAQSQGSVSVNFFGDGATGEGVLTESLNFAALRKLPMIFVCENNLYATHLRVDEFRPKEPIYKMAEPFGIKTFQIDGNNVLEVFEKAKEAVEICKKGEGPVFIECLTYRMRGHVGPDDNIQGDHTDIRPDSEIEEWKKKDPIDNFEKYLLENGFELNELENIKKEVQEEVDEANRFAKESPNPNPNEVNKYVFK